MLDPEKHRSLTGLRRQLADRFPAAHQAKPTPDPTSTPLANPAGHDLHIPPGEVTEVVLDDRCCGAALLVQQLWQSRQSQSPPSAAAQPSHPSMALVDGHDSFDPESYPNALCTSLLWVRTRSATTALQATDWLVRDGNLPLVLLDLSLNPATELRRLPLSSWFRIRTVARHTGTSCLVLSAPGATIPRPAHRHHLPPLNPNLNLTLNLNLNPRCLSPAA